MRVLMTADAVGGVWQYSLALARGLVERHGCEVMLVCLGDVQDDALSEASTALRAEVVALPRRLEWMPHSETDVRLSLDEVRGLVERWKPDVIHSNQYCFGLLASGPPVVVVAHSDVLSWHAWHRCRTSRDTFDLAALESIVRGDPFLRWYSDLVSTALAAASAVVAPSHFVAGSLERIYRARSTVIHNGLWPDGHGPGEKERVALVAGRLWDEAKNAALAVRAAEGLPLSLLLVGPRVGPAGEQAPQPEADNATYLGPRTPSEVRDLMSRAWVYLATSTYEPFGLSTLEAALSGCALIANDTPSNRELWDGAALFHRYDDAPDLRSRLAGLLQEPEQLRRWAHSARLRALDRFGADRMAREYARLYRGLLDRQGGADRPRKR